MANILFLADGTWNGPARPTRRAPRPTCSSSTACSPATTTRSRSPSPREQERRLVENGSLVQIAKYLRRRRLVQRPRAHARRGVRRGGVIARIVRGYLHLAALDAGRPNLHRRLQPRRLPTARSLAGLIAARACCRPRTAPTREQAYRIGAAVWAAYREQRDEPDDRRSVLAEVLSHLPSFLDPASQRAARPSGPLRPASVACLAVWDTVGALGIPVWGRAATSGWTSSASAIAS